MTLAALVLLVSAASAAPAAANVPDLSEIPETRAVRYAERTELDMEGATLEGEVVKPQVGFTAEPPRPTHGNAIQLRSDFDVEMASSLALVR